MLILCLDANVYLSFYHFSDNDLENLEKIIGLIDAGELKILLPKQIENEYYRNRENKIKDAIQKIKESKIDLGLPRISQPYEERDKLITLKNSFISEKNILIERIESDASKHELKADILIQKIFNKAEKIPLTDDIFLLAQKRSILGNPPGKKGSYGDAILWETLLGYKDPKVDIYLVSQDGDFNCDLEPTKLKNFLQMEWTSEHSTVKNDGEIYFYNGLNLFFDEKFPNIKITDDYFKEKYISDLENSGSFDETRITLHRLSRYENFSLDQINRLAQAATTNSQIYVAKTYSPWITERLNEIIKPYKSKMDFNILMQFLEKYNYDEYKEIEDEIMAQNYDENGDDALIIEPNF